MRKIAISLFLLWSALPLPAQNAADEASIRDLVSRYVAAREARDAKAVAAVFTADADQLVSSGEWRKGRDNVVQGSLASSEAAGGKRTISVESIRFLSPDVAVADGRYEITGGAGAQDRRMWTTLMVSRTRDGWRIAAIRNMLPAAAAR